MPLARFGVLGLAAVALVHEIAEVVVILNGLRAPEPATRRKGCNRTLIPTERSQTATLEKSERGPIIPIAAVSDRT